ncbi:MAG: uracil-DNA glycosylase, partial [Paracoccaceae bacterium]
ITKNLASEARSSSSASCSKPPHDPSVLPDQCAPVKIMQQSPIEVSGLTKATVGPAMRERTATEIHLARARVSRKIFFWNVFPFHPHEADEPQTNRMHTRRERDAGIQFLKTVLTLLPLNRVVTIGNDATHAVQGIDVECCSVRHPSYGGQREFHQQINRHYGVIERTSAQGDLFNR